MFIIEAFKKTIDFFESKIAEHAVVRNIEVIGEASKHLSATFKEKHKGIPWNAFVTGNLSAVAD